LRAFEGSVYDKNENKSAIGSGVRGSDGLVPKGRIEMIELVSWRELRGEAMTAAMDHLAALGFPNSGIAAGANVIQLGKAIRLAPNTVEQLESGFFAKPIIGFVVPRRSFAALEADSFWGTMRHTVCISIIW
jgi:hypothetical protein